MDFRIEEYSEDINQNVDNCDTLGVSIEEVVEEVILTIEESYGGKGEPGKSAYQLYLENTTDDPVLTLEEWTSAKNTASSEANVITATYEELRLTSLSTLAEKQQAIASHLEGLEVKAGELVFFKLIGDDSQEPNMNIDGGNASTIYSQTLTLDGKDANDGYMIQFRRSLAEEWTSSNPILLEAEIGYEIDTKKIKIGDGVTTWNETPYFNENNIPSEPTSIWVEQNLYETYNAKLIKKISGYSGGTGEIPEDLLSNVGKYYGNGILTLDKDLAISFYSQETGNTVSLPGVYTFEQIF